MTSALAILRQAIAQVPAVRYALGVGGVCSIVAIVLLGWKLEPATAVIGALAVLVAMVVLVVFAALAKIGGKAMRPLAMVLAWSFLLLTVATSGLFVACAFFDKPKSLPCLLRNEGCPEFEREPLETSEAVSILTDCYAGRFLAVYERFSDSFKATTSLEQFRVAAERQLAQLGSGPASRRLRSDDTQAQYRYILYEAAFDERSTWLEAISFVSTSSGWRLFGVNFQPASWSGVVGASPLPFATASAFMRAINSGQVDTSVEDQWIPLSGWTLRVVSPRTRRGARTCDVELDTGEGKLVAESVLGGCALTAGASVLIGGRLVSKGPVVPRFADVRYQLAL